MTPVGWVRHVSSKRPYELDCQPVRLLGPCDVLTVVRRCALEDDVRASAVVASQAHLALAARYAALDRHAVALPQRRHALADRRYLGCALVACTALRGGQSATRQRAAVETRLTMSFTTIESPTRPCFQKCTSEPQMPLLASLALRWTGAGSQTHVALT